MRRRKVVVLAVVAAALAVAAAPALADLKLPSVIGSHMVLQRGINLPIWGWAEPGEAVTVAIAGQSVATKADAQGKWRVVLKPLKPGDPLEMTLTGKKPTPKPKPDELKLEEAPVHTVKLANILVGDVWVCSGQSNMQMSVQGCNNAKRDIAAATFPKIRLFSVRLVTKPTPQADCQGSWKECAPASVPGFSAVGYYFGREIHKRLDVPIGLINTSWGGTPAESWTERSFLEAHDECLPILARWFRRVEAYPEAKKKYDETIANWAEIVKKAKMDRKPAPRRPRDPNPFNSSHYPSGLYNAMIAPLVPFGIKGAIWYQGESNAGRAYQYRVLFPAMIQSWRKVWAQGDFPFFWVQLANFLQVDDQPKGDPWPELREAQAMTLSLPNTGRAVIIDIGEARDIHPKNKQDVGRRLALSALKVAYGQDLVHSGPVYDTMTVEGAKARIKFKSIGGGLVAPPFKDPVTPDGPTLQKCYGVADPAKLRPKSEVLGFAIAGEDKKFVWAQATIEGDCVVVSSDKVAKPVAVRYGWSNNPICNLTNKEGLPASPFRTDDWPGVTLKNR